MCPAAGPAGWSRAPGLPGLLVGLLAGLLALSGCSGDEQPPPGAGDSAAPLATRVSIGPVTGRLTPRERSALAADVGAVVDRWFAADFLRDDFPLPVGAQRFPGFTPGAVPRSRSDLAVMTLGALEQRTDATVATRRAVRIEPLVVRHRTVGLTARFVLEFDTVGAAEHHVAVSGRLFLTPGRGPHDWRIFGYDVSSSTTAAGSASPTVTASASSADNSAASATGSREAP